MIRAPFFVAAWIAGFPNRKPGKGVAGKRNPVYNETVGEVTPLFFSPLKTAKKEIRFHAKGVFICWFWNMFRGARPTGKKC